VGSYATLQVRVWDITKYGTFAQAFVAGDYGWSMPFNFRAPDFAHGAPATTAYMENFRGIGLPIGMGLPIPEPAALTLGALAGGAWLVWRWRCRRQAHLN